MICLGGSLPSRARQAALLVLPQHFSNRFLLAFLAWDAVLVRFVIGMSRALLKELRAVEVVQRRHRRRVGLSLGEGTLYFRSASFGRAGIVIVVGLDDSTAWIDDMPWPRRLALRNRYGTGYCRRRIGMALNQKVVKVLGAREQLNRLVLVLPPGVGY